MTAIATRFASTRAAGKKKKKKKKRAIGSWTPPETLWLCALLA